MIIYKNNNVEIIITRYIDEWKINVLREIESRWRNISLTSRWKLHRLIFSPGIDYHQPLRDA